MTARRRGVEAYFMACASVCSTERVSLFTSLAWHVIHNFLMPSGLGFFLHRGQNNIKRLREKPHYAHPPVGFCLARCVSTSPLHILLYPAILCQVSSYPHENKQCIFSYEIPGLFLLIAYFYTNGNKTQESPRALADTKDTTALYSYCISFCTYRIPHSVAVLKCLLLLAFQNVKSMVKMCQKRANTKGMGFKENAKTNWRNSDMTPPSVNSGTMV